MTTTWKTQSKLVKYESHMGFVIFVKDYKIKVDIKLFNLLNIKSHI